MSSPKTEESFPLLLLFLEEDNKAKQSKYRFFGSNNRYTRISEGAGNVLSQWPNHVSTCGASIIIFLIMFLMVSITFLALSVRPTTSPKCTPYDLNESNLRISLMHSSSAWTPSEIEAVKVILEKYPKIRIDIFQLHNHPKRKRNHKIKNNPLENLLSANKDLVRLRDESLEDYFAFSPLYSAWKRLNKELVEFAARTLMIFEYGGISFKLPKLTAVSNATLNRFNSSADEEWMVESLLKSNLSTFRKLPKDVVNIDDEGTHMETKMPCHAYFGELLMSIRGANTSETASDLIVKTLKLFCKSGAVNEDLCLKFGEK